MKEIIQGFLAFTIIICLTIIFILPIKPDKRVQKLSPDSIIRNIARHVVSYNILSSNNKRFATGFHIKHNGGTYILTNKHVCDLNMRTYGHNNIQFEDYVGKVIAIDTQHDLCLVTSNRKEGLKLSWFKPRPLDEMILIGHPRGLAKTVRKGYYVNKEKINAPWIGEGLYDTYNISTITYGGNSGSPVCNSIGEVTGVLFAGSYTYHTEGVVVPLEYVRSFLDKHTGLSTLFK